MYDFDDPIWSNFEKHAINTSYIQSKCHCGDNDSITLTDGQYICQRCNIVTSQLIDHSAEWRCMGNDEGKNFTVRCCQVPNDSNEQLGTQVSSSLRNNNFSRNQNLHRRFQVWSSYNYKERTLNNIYEFMTNTVSPYFIPSCIIDDAKSIYKRVSDVKITRGGNRSSVIAICVYLACKKCEVPRSIKEIGQMFNIKFSALTKACKFVQDIIEPNEINFLSNTPSNAEDFINRFCSKLDFNHSTTNEIKRILKKVDDMNIVCDAMPTSIAGGVIMFTGSDMKLHKVPPVEIAKACSIATVTVIKIGNRLKQYRTDLI